MIRKTGNWENWNMSIIAFYNCKDLNEARQKEQHHYVELKATLNSIEPMKSVSIHPKKKHDEIHITIPPSMNKHRVCYNCEPCGFTTDNKTDYERHVNTPKHNKNVQYHTNTHESSTTTSHKYTCPSCHKIFKHRTSVYKHKTVCPGLHPPMLPTTSAPSLQDATSVSACVSTAAPSISSTPTEQYLLDVIVKNQELTSAMMILIQQNTELQSKMLELCINNPTSNTTNNSNNTNNNTNSHNNITNCNNPTFNMNMFLNEKCKDAMNMKDFVNSIQLNMTDMENMDRLGYVEGMSTIFIDNLQKTDLYKRPVHCSDTKRETLYVKENNQWEREGPDHTNMTKAVLAVEHKNVVLVNE